MAAFLTESDQKGMRAILDGSNLLMRLPETLITNVFAELRWRRQSPRLRASNTSISG